MADAKLNRICLWGIPRCLSTVLIKCLSGVDGIQIATQLYADAHYFRPGSKPPEPDNPQVSKMSGSLSTVYRKISQGEIDPSLVSFESARDALEAAYPGKKILLYKDQAQYLEGNYDILPRGFKHSFIIRHPNKLFSSYRKMLLEYWGDFSDMRALPPMVFPPGCGYKELFELVEYVRENIDPKPVILDVDDLLLDPAGILSAYCSRMGIPYSSNLLSWEAGRDITSSWLGTKFFLTFGAIPEAYQHVFGSEGFGRPTPIPEMASLPDDVQACVRYSMSYYESLHRERIVVSHI